MIKNIILIILIFSFGISCDKPMPGSGKKKNVMELKLKDRKKNLLENIEKGNAKALETQKLFIQINETLKQLEEFKQSPKSYHDRLKILFTVPEDLFEILMKVKKSAKESVKSSTQLLHLAIKAQGIKESVIQSKLMLKQAQSLYSKAQQAEKLLATFFLTFQKSYGYVDTVQLFSTKSDPQKNTLNLSLTQQDPGPDSNALYVQNKFSLSNHDILYTLTTSSMPIKNITKSGNLLIKTLDTLLNSSKEASELPLIKILNKKLTKITNPSVLEEDTNTKKLTHSNLEDKKTIQLTDPKIQNKEETKLSDSQMKKKKLAELAASQIEVEDTLEPSEPQVDNRDSSQISDS